jgi:hypothetical protein
MITNTSSPTASRTPKRRVERIATSPKGEYKQQRRNGVKKAMRKES